MCALSLGCTRDDAAREAADGRSSIDCEVAIVGGGAGGLHTAYRLGAMLGERVCLFEKESELGGRIHDVKRDSTLPDSARVGVGARRVMETQDVLFNLARELNLTLEKPPLGSDLINARGIFSFSKDDIRARAYARIPEDPDPEIDQETWLYNKLRSGPDRARTQTFPDFRSYIREVTGEEEYAFLRDMSRFRGDFEYSLDAEGYLDYLDEEWDVCCTPSYPVGGMSAFIRGMAERATAEGVRIFVSEPVHDLRREAGAYALSSARYHVRAKKVVVAVPPVALESMTGDVVEEIKSQALFQEIIGVRVVTITQWWPEAWWRELKNPAVAENAEIHRAWTTDHCLNFIEIPSNPAIESEKVTRTVYNDDLLCVQFWETLAKTSSVALEAELKRGLEHLFNDNGVSAPARVTIPAPLKTHVQIWPAAWHWLRAGARHTNQQLLDWSVEPLPGEDVALVGEAYNVQRSGWSDAAFKSSIRLLNQKYGFTLSLTSGQGLTAQEDVGQRLSVEPRRAARRTGPSDR